MATILVVEDDYGARLLTATKLKPYFVVETACDGVEALNVIYAKKIDLIVADIMMPNMDGYALVKTLRQDNNSVPIILLTAKQSFENKREGFNLGVDDYLTKPVNFDELLLRINALLRRAKISMEQKITVGDTIIDSVTYSVICKNESVLLPKKEFDLLFKLLSYPNIIFTKNQLLDDLWGMDSVSGEDTVKTHINRLRGKLKCVSDFSIVTLKGIGYKAILAKKDISSEIKK